MLRALWAFCKAQGTLCVIMFKMCIKVQEDGGTITTNRVIVGCGCGCGCRLQGRVHYHPGRLLRQLLLCRPL